MKKTKEREIVEPGAFVRRFCSTYIVILFIALLATDIIFETNDYENVVLIRGAIMVAATILGTIVTIKSLNKKYIIKKDLQDLYSKFTIMAVIAIALLSILYFMYCVKSEVNNIKDTSEYKLAQSFVGSKGADYLVEQAADKAREQWYSIWGIMIASSVVTIPIIKKTIEQCSEEVKQQEEPIITSKENDE